MRKILLFILMFQASFAYSTHIVGGEFALIEKRGGLYDLNLFLYFDDINGNPLAIDETIDVSVFRKSDNAQIECLTLPLFSNEIVPYDNPNCAVDNLVIRLLQYRTEEEFVLSNPNIQTQVDITLPTNVVAEMK